MVRAFAIALTLVTATSLASAQVVTEVKSGDTIVVHWVGEVRLLGVDALSTAAPDTREGKCAAITKALVYQVAHTREVRLVRDEPILKELPLLKSFYYVYLPDGRMLNDVVLATGCARQSVYTDKLRFGSMLKSVADSAQAANRGLYAPTDADPALRDTSPSRPYGGQGVTMEGFNKITIGMDRVNVNAILGSSGTEASRSETASSTSSRYEWKTDDGSGFILIGFNDDRVRSKHQYGLK